MIHPIFSAVLKRPDLVLRHLQNYVALVKDEASEAARGLVVQAIGGLVAAIALMLALVLTGVAVMLGVLHGSFHWVLAVVPGIAWLCAAIGGVLAVRSRLPKDIRDVREEVELDLRILQLAKELKND